jgi:hypothetical protein
MDCDRRVSSLLFKIEILVGIRRSLGPFEKELKNVEARLRDYLREVEMRKIDEEIIDRIEEISVGPLRTLDMIHLSSAMDFQESFQRIDRSVDFSLVSFDQQMNRAAQRLGIKIPDKLKL